MKDDDEVDAEIKKTLENVSLWIRSERVRANLSQIDLAHRAGLSQNHVYSIEAGQRFPNMLTFLKICRALKINPAHSFKHPDEERQKDREIIFGLLGKYL
jgi:transcriptional regulator with XRE-family HTH domain